MLMFKRERASATKDLINSNQKILTTIAQIDCRKSFFTCLKKNSSNNSSERKNTYRRG